MAELAAGLQRRLGMAVIAVLAGCERSPPPSPPAPPRVTVVTLKAQAVPITTELPGRIAAFRVADVRRQVSGIILKRQFVEGGEVRAGHQLYQIDPALYQAAWVLWPFSRCGRPLDRWRSTPSPSCAESCSTAQLS